MTSPVSKTPLDSRGRPLRNLRLSVTDRCDLRCGYCMPEETYTWLPRKDILSFEEIVCVVRAFTLLGIQNLRLTGGEPLLRRDLHELVRLIRASSEVDDLALTTNGLALVAQARELHDAGLSRVTVSLDSLRPERFLEITRRGRLADVLAGVRHLREVGFDGTKIDTVVMRGVNDDELVDLVEFGKREGAEVRFIEYMDVGGATRWSHDAVVSRTEMLERLAAHYGSVEAVDEKTSAPADRFLLPDGTTFGVISSTTEPFCGSCDRSRLTADGTWYLCLYAASGTDLRAPLRAGASAEELAGIIHAGWATRDARGAEERLEHEERDVLLRRDDLRGDPRLEMHTRGG